MKKLIIDVEKLAGAVLVKRQGAALARHMGVSRQTITNKFSGTYRISLEDLNKIAEFLDRDASDFVKEIEKAA